MYGLLHKALVSWLQSLPDGDALIRKVLSLVDIEGKPDDFFRHYSAENTGSFLKAVMNVMGRSEDEVKYEAGKFFLVGIMESGYGHSLRTLGNSFFDMLSNLDSLHSAFLPSFPKMRAPSIRPIRNEDGSMTIHYYSSNSNLGTFMQGALEAAALQLYDLDIHITHRVKKGQGSNHDIYHVFMDSRGFGDGKTETREESDSCSLQIGLEMTNELFPWHFAMDRDLRIVSLGKHIATRFKNEMLGKNAKKIFRLVHPVDSAYEFDAFKDMAAVACTFSVDHKLLKEESVGTDNELTVANLMAGVPGDGSISPAMSGGSLLSNMSSFRGSANDSANMLMRANRLATKAENIKLHGQVSYHEQQDIIIFFGVPALRSLEEMEAQRIDLYQMPLHSHGRELLYGSMFQSASAKNTTEIDRRMAELDASMAEIQTKKEQIDGLLHSILPPAVAGALSRGEIPDAERFDEVTVLFCDIAGFTNISSQIPASEVMEMLHELFVEFDSLADKHGCYKVETIGDAYMVAAGCPDPCDDHAVRVARLALDMVRTAKTVMSPLDGEPIRIRVGLHSGPLMAGVVGRARPRYCFFGSTVSVASLMESNGLPGCIQTSFRFTQALPDDHPFELVTRGHISVDAKGTMKTFLLLGAEDEPGLEPLLPIKGIVDDIGPSLIEASSKSSSIADRLSQVNSFTVRSRMQDQRIPKTSLSRAALDQLEAEGSE